MVKKIKDGLNVLLFQSSPGLCYQGTNCDWRWHCLITI